MSDPKKKPTHEKQRFNRRDCERILAITSAAFESAIEMSGVLPTDAIGPTRALFASYKPLVLRQLERRFGITFPADADEHFAEAFEELDQ